MNSLQPTSTIVPEKTMKQRLFSGLNRLGDWLAYPLIRAGFSPNALSLTGAFLMVGSSVLLAFDMRWPAVGVGLIGGLLDNMDGRVARATNRSTIWGAFLDSSLDRMAEIAMAMGVLVYMNIHGAMTVPFVLWVVAGIGFSQVVSYLRARTESLGGNGRVGLLQRQHRGILTLIGLMTGTKGIYAVIVLITVLSVITVVQRMQNFYRYVKESESGA